MQKRYSITLKNFLENKKFNNKSFFINANDELVLENDNKKVEEEKPQEKNETGILNRKNFFYSRFTKVKFDVFCKVSVKSQIFIIILKLKKRLAC